MIRKRHTRSVLYYKKAQAAVEMLIIIAAALLILLSILSVNDKVMTGTSGKITSTKARAAVDTLSNAAELVYQQGVGSRTRVFVTLPDEIQNFSASGQTLNIQLYAGGNLRDTYRSFDFNVSGILPDDEGNYWIYVKSLQGSVIFYDSANETAAAYCGDLVVDAGEDCDSSNLGGKNCLSQGYLLGTLSCYSNCTFDTSNCALGIAPVINLISDSPDPIMQGNSITITANATDDINVSSVWVDINGTNYTMVQQSGGSREVIEFIGCEDDAAEEAKWEDDDSDSGTLECKTDAEIGDASARTGSYSLALSGNFDPNTDSWNRTINISGYSSVNISLWTSTEDTESSDDFKIYYWNSTAWALTIDETRRSGSAQVSWQETKISIPDSAVSSDFQIRATWETSSANEHMMIDDINVTGIPAFSTDIWELSHNTTGENGLVNYTIYANDTDSLDAEQKTGNYTVNIEGTPTHSAPILNSTDGSNDTSQNLTCYNQSTNDPNGDNVKNIFNWKKDGTYVNLLNMPFEGGSNSTWTRDYSLGNNGTITGASWNSTGGYDGRGAYEFDGISNYMNISSDINEYLGGTASFTAWIKTSQTGHDTIWLAPGLTGIESSGDGNDVFWGWIDASGNMGIQAGNTAGAKTTGPINDGRWHHIAMTRDSSSGEVKIYVDGVLNDTATSESGVKSNSFYSIGRIEDTGGSPEYFNGTIDDINIFNYTISEEQINALYNNRTDLIVSDETSAADVWQCEIIPNDGTEDGIIIGSNNLSITSLENTTVFYDGFEWSSSDDCGHGGVWDLCDGGDGQIRRSSDEYNGTYAVKFENHDADTNYLIECADLSSYSSAYITFFWKKSSLESGEYLKLDINKTGSGYTNIFDSGTGSSSYAKETIDISNYISSNTCAKFHSLSPAGNDEIRVDDFRIIGTS